MNEIDPSGRLVERVADALGTQLDWLTRANLLAGAEAVVVDDLGLVRETRIRWEWPKIPDGWRLCENQTLTDDGRLWRTATNAPRHEAPHEYETEYLEATRFVDERWVTPWATRPQVGHEGPGHSPEAV